MHPADVQITNYLEIGPKCREREWWKTPVAARIVFRRFELKESLLRRCWTYRAAAMTALFIRCCLRRFPSDDLFFFLRPCLFSSLLCYCVCEWDRERCAARLGVINTTPPAHLLYRLYLFWCPFPKMKTLSIIAPPRAVRRVSVLH